MHLGIKRHTSTFIYPSTITHTHTHTQLHKQKFQHHNHFHTIKKKVIDISKWSQREIGETIAQHLENCDYRITEESRIGSTSRSQKS